jgi:uncharacterized protein (TIGR04255 family)
MTLKKIPERIDDTIQTAVCEIRYQLAIPENELLGRVFPILGKRYPKFEPTGNQAIPPQLRMLDPQLMYLADYRFSHEKFAVAVGSRAIVFEYLTGYEGWNTFFGSITEILAELGNMQLFLETEKIGLRYINVIEGEYKLQDVIDLNLRVNLPGHSEKNLVFRNEFEIDDAVIILNIHESGNVNKAGVNKKGIVIDVDVQRTKNLSLIGPSLGPIIEDLHAKEKVVFFNSLTQPFIDSRNPLYKTHSS